MRCRRRFWWHRFVAGLQRPMDEEIFVPTKSLLGTWLVVVALWGSGCSKPSIQIDGSSTVYPITEAVAEEFKAHDPGVRVTVGLSGTSGGMKKFVVGEIDICDASRPIKDAEIASCKSNGIEYIELQVAFDGLSVVVNPENNWVDCLTVEQLKSLWQPESTVQKWSDLNPDWPNEPIKLYGPGTDSGTFEYFTEAIVGEARKSRGDYSPSEDDNMLVTGVSGGKYALGYFGYAYYEENKDRLKLLGIDNGDGNCVKPSVEAVRNGTYKPLSRPLFIYVNKKALERPEIREFVEFYVTNASKLAGEIGYVAAPDDVDARNRELLESTLKATTPTS
jgi:phosphate transport system substrate-binding protein